jgi:hypothetical protein
VSIFSPAGSSQVTAVVSGATNPTVTNISLTASTEVGLALPASCRQFLIKLRGANASLQVAYAAGTSGTTFLTVPPGNFYADSALSTSSVTLYVQTPQAAQTVELLTWT